MGPINKELMGNWIAHGVIQPDSSEKAWTWTRLGIDIGDDVRAWMVMKLYNREFPLKPGMAREVEAEGFDPETGMVRW